MNASTEPIHKFSGTVVKGFGRGGKQLGCPTANLDRASVENLTISQGVYYGLAKVNSDAPEPMVMSVGWNPQFDNQEKSVEVHILKDYPDDFYGATLKVIVLGFIRGMEKFDNLDALIRAIENDKSVAKKNLGDLNLEILSKDVFFG
eukprot:TRINITY_DN5337_c0_g1_i1.p1 TRINITY_DN5337_c0_g1~~TRINITY_DN5337_c0_g1_i1.p1  ORF type:complete len:147 (+),score=36.28 TRINITY_DN5337_c0_g1_i1:88-528(+)